MKHVLIPTDFSINSLNAVHAAVAKYEGVLNITLFHLMAMSGDISDLLYRSRRNKHLELITDDFNEAMQILQNRYGSRIRTIRVKFGFGDTPAYLRNFLEGERADVILVSPDIKLKLSSNRSVEIVPLLQASGTQIDWVPAAGAKKSFDMGAINMFIGNELNVPETKDKRYAAEK